MKRRQRFDISLLALACFALAICPLASGKSVMVPMRDGVKLPTIISLPGSGSCPVILTRGYTAGGLSNHMMWLALGGLNPRSHANGSAEGSLAAGGALTSPLHPAAVNPASDLRADPSFKVFETG